MEGNSKEPLIAHFESYLPFEEDEKALKESRVKPLNVKCRKKILQAGAVCRYYTFVVSGCFLVFQKNTVRPNRTSVSPEVAFISRTRLLESFPVFKSIFGSVAMAVSAAKKRDRL